MHKIQYESLCKYKYRLLADLVLACSIKGVFVRTEYIELQPDGRLTLRKGYAWDGASGPTLDTESTMAGSAGHDALYQLISLKALPASMRALADDDLRRWCIEDGMHPARASYWHEWVSIFGGLFT